MGRGCGHPVKAILAARGIHQYELSARAGINFPKLNAILNGRLEASIADQRSIADALGAEVSALFPEAVAR